MEEILRSLRSLRMTEWRTQNERKGAQNDIGEVQNDRRRDCFVAALLAMTQEAGILPCPDPEILRSLRSLRMTIKTSSQ